MYSSPVHAVPKPGSDALCLINDQSANKFSPNSMIDSKDVAGTCMDGIKSLGASLCAFHKVEGDDIELLMNGVLKLMAFARVAGQEDCVSG